MEKHQTILPDDSTWEPVYQQIPREPTPAGLADRIVLALAAKSRAWHIPAWLNRLSLAAAVLGVVLALFSLGELVNAAQVAAAQIEGQDVDTWLNIATAEVGQSLTDFVNAIFGGAVDFSPLALVALLLLTCAAFGLMARVLTDLGDKLDEQSREGHTLSAAEGLPHA